MLDSSISNPIYLKAKWQACFIGCTTCMHKFNISLDCGLPREAVNILNCFLFLYFISAIFHGGWNLEYSQSHGMPDKFSPLEIIGSTSPAHSKSSYSCQVLNISKDGDSRDSLSTMPQDFFKDYFLFKAINMYYNKDSSKAH